MPLTQLAIDLRSARTTPDYAFITPNLWHDMHDGPIAAGDRWLARTVPLILASPAFRTTRSLLVVTWDEEGTAANHIATILAGNAVKAELSLRPPLRPLLACCTRSRRPGIWRR